MALIPLNIPPGVFRNGTAYQAKGRWFDANLVRWKEGQLRPVGGWQKIAGIQLSGKTRKLLSWRDNSQSRLLAIGTNEGLFAFNNDILIDITPEDFVIGRENSIFGLGWGASIYGDDAYGTERAESGLILEAATWSFDTFGENLIALAPHEGNIYQWVPTTTLPIPKAELIAAAPVECRAILVSEERHLVAFGASGNPRLVVWSAREDNTTWTPTATNSAGDLELVTNGEILAARRMPGQILIWTDQDLHVMQFLGQPFVYGIERAGEGGLAGPNAHMAFGNSCVWMGDKGFWLFDGAIQPLQSEVSDFVFGDINMFQSVKFTAAHLQELGEIWWFYPTRNSVENNRYVIWNYRENHWSIGILPRTAWVDTGVFSNPIGADPDGKLYLQEKGFTDNGATRVGEVFAKSGVIEIGGGDQVLSVVQLIPDGCPNVPTCTQVKFDARFTPTGSIGIKGPFTFERADGYSDARFTARQVEMTVEATQDASFSFGTMRLEGRLGGRR